MRAITSQVCIWRGYDKSGDACRIVRAVSGKRTAYYKVEWEEYGYKTFDRLCDARQYIGA